MRSLSGKRPGTVNPGAPAAVSDVGRGTPWALSNALLNFHLAGLDSAALGGDLAYQIHLLVTSETGTAIAKLMQPIGRCYVHFINRACRRTGSLWEGRY